MRTAQKVVEDVRASLGAEPRVDLGQWPIELAFEEGSGVLVIEGEVRDVAAKKLALERAAAHPEVVGIVDRLHTRPSTTQDDPTVRKLVLDALLQEPAFSDLALYERAEGRTEPVRVPEAASGRIEVEVEDGVVTLDGSVSGLDRKRLAGVLAWWVPGSRDVVDGIAVDPDEADDDGAIADAIRIVLEKDPFVDAVRVGVDVREAVVTLTGSLDSEWQRNMAELDAWYVFAVDRVVNAIEVSPEPVVRREGPPPEEGEPAMSTQMAEWRVVELVEDHTGKNARRIVISDHEDEEQAVTAALTAREARAQEHADDVAVRWAVEHWGQEIDLEEAIERYEEEPE